MGNHLKNLRVPLIALLLMSTLVSFAVPETPDPAAIEPQPVDTSLTEMVPIKKLRVKDAIFLPTVRSQRVIPFTKPRTWNLTTKTYIQVEFQHSHELIPGRSWLEVVVNGSVLKHVSLTKENAKGTTMQVPIPPGLLKDENTLTFRVEQHYTDKCEDPLDPSLWTQILPPTKFVFNYTPALPAVDLASYPYPMIDPLTYSPAKIRYVMPPVPSLKETQAMAMVNINLGQAAQKKEMMTKIAALGGSSRPEEHVVYIGTPVDNPNIAKFSGSFGNYSLQGKAWQNKQLGAPVEDDAGLVFYFPDPQVKSRAILIVTGNGPEGVAKAAQFLTTPGKSEPMKGSAAMAPSGWVPDAKEPQRKPRLIETEDRTFGEMELITDKRGYDQVEKIYAPPLSYKFPIVGDFRKEGTRLQLDLLYSYGPGMNPEYSSLELRMNNRSIVNIPLMNEQGESDVKATVTIPSDLIQPQNEMVAQFHMLPDKYGYCKNAFVDKAWGRIYKDSMFHVQGPVGLRLPDLVYFGEVGYPYSRRDNFEETHLVMPKQPDAATLQALLGLTTRMGRDTKTDTDLRFTMGEGSDPLPADRDVLAIMNKSSDTVQDNRPVLPDGLFILSWPEAAIKPFLKQFRLSAMDAVSDKMQDSGMAAYLEQRLAPNKDNRVITEVTGKRDEALIAVSRFFESDEEDLWDKFTSGSLKQFSITDQVLSTADRPVFREEKGSTMVSQLYGGVPFPVFIGLGLLMFLILILSPVILRKLKK